MSLVNYLSCAKKLPLGQFGTVKLMTAKESIGKNEAYEKAEDAAGICVSELNGNIEGIRKHFKNQFIYVISPNLGKFLITEELKKINEHTYRINKKCITELFNYVKGNIGRNEEIEVYSCWYGEENDEKKQEVVIDINEIENPEKLNEFLLQDKQYILFTNKL